MSLANDSRPHVLITIPNEGWVHNTVLAAAIRMSKDDRVTGELVQQVIKPTAASMCWAAKQVRNKPAIDYWITIDSDNPPIQNPIDLIFLGKDVISCPTVVGRLGTQEGPLGFWNAMFHAPDGHGYVPASPGDGLQRIDATGAGCLVIARRVCEELKAPFAYEFTEDGLLRKGHDFVFSDKCERAGIEIYAHWDYCCLHWHEFEMTQAINRCKHFFLPPTADLAEFM